MTLQDTLERYIRQEGLYEFLPSVALDWKERFVNWITVYWLLTISLASSAISVLYGKEWFVGFLIPVGTVLVGVIEGVIYLTLRSLIRKQHVLSITENVFILGSFLILGSLWMWVYTGIFLGALLFVGASLITLLFYALIVNKNNYYYFAQKIIQSIRRVVFTTSNAVSVFPLALITLLLTLISGNLLNTVASLDSNRVVIVVIVIIVIFYLGTINPRRIS